MKHSFSESSEILNAFVDDELDAEERQALLNEQMDDPQLADAICELRVLKDLVRAARPGSEKFDNHISMPKQRSFSRWFAAASVLLVLFTLVSITTWPPTDETAIAGNISPTYTNVLQLLQSQAQGKPLKMVLHITAAEPSVVMRLFTQLEQVLAFSASYQRNVLVQVIASGQGISLLQQDKSPYQDKIKFISAHYDTVEFVVCQRSMLRQAVMHNMDISIMPEALITHSGPELIKRRQKQGWATIII